MLRDASISAITTATARSDAIKQSVRLSGRDEGVLFRTSGNVPAEGTDTTAPLEDIEAMPRVIYIHSNGERNEVEVPIGQNLMMAATGHDIEGIVGDCGGAMSCATCHVMVEEPFAALLPAPDDTENQMLDFTAAPRESNSRLSCQIVMSDMLDGIAVRIADPQL
jgi:ferredoxin, 2Fe-2S